GLQVGEASLARDEDDRAGDPPALHVSSQGLGHAVEALGGQSDLFGLGCRQIGRAGGGGCQELEDQDKEQSLHDAPPGFRISAPGAASSSHALTVMASML